MSNNSNKVYNEDVLVFPSELLDEIGRFQGYVDHKHEQYLRLVMDTNLRFLDRNLAEVDPNFKQLIPYIVLRYQNSVLTYSRSKTGGEDRLHAFRSIGFGGHINPEDDERRNSSLIYQGILRELKEEINYTPSFVPSLRGFLNDDENDVGKVHFGAVYVSFVRDLQDIDLAEVEHAVTDPKWIEIAELKHKVHKYEPWSALLIKEML
jgi:predicted NUDIX family phosphoesterase